MTALKVTGQGRANRLGQSQPSALVQGRAAHPGIAPGRAKMRRPLIGARFKAPAGEHHGIGVDLGSGGGAHTRHVAFPIKQCGNVGVEHELAPSRLRQFPFAVDQPLALACCGQRQPAPETIATLREHRLSIIDRLEGNAGFRQPSERRAAFPNQQALKRVEWRAIGETAQVRIKLGLGVGAEVAGRDAGILCIDQGQHIVPVPVGEAHGPGRVAAVATEIGLAARLQNDDLGTLLSCRQSSA